MKPQQFEVSTFAPVNIAWIKYMGKANGLPTNSSLSVTLKNTGTKVRLIADVFNVSTPAYPVVLNFLEGSYIPPVVGKEKLVNFLSRYSMWLETLNAFGYQVQFPSRISIFTENNAPAASGVATSASSFAAFTLAYASLLTGEHSEQFQKHYSEDQKLKLALAKVASLGSGSACRSFHGPIVEWSPEHGVSVFKSPMLFANIVFLVESSPKAVSSSEAHERVKTSSLFAGRTERAEMRLRKLKALLRVPSPDFSEIRTLVWEESEDMHSLFHTAKPPFYYQTELSKKIANSILIGEGPTANGILTQDAGANLHLFFPSEEIELWKSFVAKQYPDVRILFDDQSEGAHFV